MEYLKCNFSKNLNRNEREVRIDDIKISRNGRFHYLGSIL